MRRLHSLPLVLAAVVPGVFAPTASADVRLPAVLSSHMVIQRDRPVPVWGTAAAGERVTVTVQEQMHETTAGADGRWRVDLRPLPAGGPDTIVITGKNTITLEDVLVGEVWVGAGQSNMAGSVKEYMTGDEIIKNAAAVGHPKLRCLVSGRAGWEPATPETVKSFSALLFAFGLRLESELNVPVGLIVGAAGGTPSGPWVSEAALAADAGIAAARAGAKSPPPAEAKKPKDPKTPSAEASQRVEKQLAKQEDAAEKRAEKKKAAATPGSPEPAGSPGKSADGQKHVGRLYAAHIRPLIPFAIRGVLWDQGESGTGIDGVDQFLLMGALIRGWRADWGQGDFPFLYVQKPSGGGCAWDPTDATTRKADKFVMPPAAVPAMADGYFRETHIKIMSYPNTALVTTSDLGFGIHPVNKSGYADRACRVALGAVYGKPLEYYGPVYQGYAIEGNRVRIKFTHTGQGLVGRHAEKLLGFAVAGEDRKFYWADAEIDGETVFVSSEKVPKPAAVRYAFSARFPWANLFNADGLPALSFRTDSW